MMEDSSLNKYLDEIGRSELLTDERERELSERIRKGDQKAVNELVEANLRFVVKIAQQYRGRGVELDDLVSEGNIGLMKAASKFDATRGTRFVNFAVVYIREQIEKALPAAPEASVTQVSHRSGAPHEASLDAPLGHRAGVSLLSVLVNKDVPDSDARVYSAAIEEAIVFALESLSERERQIVNSFYGIGQEHETMAEIAEDMGLKRERVRQIREKALRRLRKAYHHRLKEMR